MAFVKHSLTLRLMSHYDDEMFYEEVLPSPLLKSYVKCYWNLEYTNHEDRIERVVPDGRMELIFHYGDPFRQVDEKDRTQSRSLISGQITEAVLLRPDQKVGILAVRFLPPGFTAIFGESASTLTGQITEFSSLAGKIATEVEEQILESKTLVDRVRILEKMLIQFCTKSRVLDRVARLGSQLLYENPVESTILHVADQFGISVRTLERQFKTQVGLSPSKFIKIARFQRALRIKNSNPTATLALVAAESGYYDQAHFSRDFKDLTGLSPAEYFGAPHDMNDLFT